MVVGKVNGRQSLFIICMVCLCVCARMRACTHAYYNGCWIPWSWNYRFEPPSMGVASAFNHWTFYTLNK